MQLIINKLNEILAYVRDTNPSKYIDINGLEVARSNNGMDVVIRGVDDVEDVANVVE